MVFLAPNSLNSPLNTSCIEKQGPITFVVLHSKQTLILNLHRKFCKKPHLIQKVIKREEMHNPLSSISSTIQMINNISTTTTVAFE